MSPRRCSSNIRNTHSHCCSQPTPQTRRAIPPARCVTSRRCRPGAQHHAQVALRKAQLLFGLRRRAEAHAAALSAASRLDPDPAQFRALAQVLSDCQDPENARTWLLKALETLSGKPATTRRHRASRVPRQPRRRSRGTPCDVAAHPTVSSRARCICDLHCARRRSSETTSLISSGGCSANRPGSTSSLRPASHSPRNTKICSNTTIHSRR